jgi:uncharacterized YkwD family protein
MNKKNKILALLLVFTFIIWSFAACAPVPARRPGNNVDYRNNSTNNIREYTAQDNMKNTGNNATDSGYSQTSSLFSKLDYSFATINENINIRSGPDAKTNIAGNLKEGDVVKVIGKLNNWYVVNVPGTNKVGCISPKYAELYSAQPGTDDPEPTRSLPSEPIKPNTSASKGNNAGNTATGQKTPAAQNSPTATGTGTLSSQGSRILQLANAERAKVGAPPLKANTELNKVATMKSQDIVEKNYFAHESPTYGSPFKMMKDYGITYMYAGENLAINSDAEKAHNAWMNSEGHRKNILNPDFTEIGIGLYPKGNGSYAYTQMFIGK